MGNKILRQRLRGPALASYYPRRIVTIKDLQREFPDFTIINEEEEDRLEHLAGYVIFQPATPRSSTNLKLLTISAYQLDSLRARGKGNAKKNAAAGKSLVSKSPLLESIYTDWPALLRQEEEEINWTHDGARLLYDSSFHHRASNAKGFGHDGPVSRLLIRSLSLSMPLYSTIFVKFKKRFVKKVCAVIPIYLLRKTVISSAGISVL